MEILLTKSQYKKLLFEEKKEQVQQDLDDSRLLVKKIVSDVKKQYGIDFTFALTWGATIGGFVGPVTRYLENTYTNLNSSDITLIMFGIILTFFSENKEKLKKVLGILKEKKLITFFDRAMMKTYDLKDAFLNFIESLNVTFGKTSNMLAYTFLVPLVPYLKHISDLDLTVDDIDLISKGISMYAGVALSSTIIRELVSKMIKRFRS